MTYQARKTVVSLGTYCLILLYFTLRLLGMQQAGGLDSDKVFRLWLIVIAASILVTVTATILSNIVYAIVEVIKTQQKPTFIEDERDEFIKLRGDRVGYIISSAGIFGAMLSFVLGQSALVMFTGLIAAGLLGQIAGDIYRLVLYRRGS